MRVSLRFVPLLVAVLLPCAARADIAPPMGYTETCTPDQQQQPGETCMMCVGAYHGDRNFCAREFGAQGFSQRCRARGASVWNEVWCASPEVAAAFTAGGASNPALLAGQAEVVAAAGSGETPVVAVAVEGSAVAAAPTPPNDAAVATSVVVEASGAAVPDAAEATAPEAEPVETPGRRGCAAGGGAFGFAAMLALAGLVRRRRGVSGIARA